jgi:hypothetical protein
MPAKANIIPPGTLIALPGESGTVYVWPLPTDGSEITGSFSATSNTFVEDPTCDQFTCYYSGFIFNASLSSLNGFLRFTSLQAMNYDGLHVSSTNTEAPNCREGCVSSSGFTIDYTPGQHFDEIGYGESIDIGGHGDVSVGDPPFQLYLEVDNANISLVSPVPLPSAFALFIGGLGGLSLLGRHRNRWSRSN